MGVNEKEKDKFVVYQIKDVAKMWMWADGRAPGDVLITWDILKTSFQKRLFPIEKL